MSVINYSKWDHIEVSDDEDDTHPNIDTPSLFRWRHQARLDREAERKKEWETLKAEKSKTEKKLKEVESKLKNQTISEAEQARAKMTKEELAKQEEEFRKKEAELERKDRETPWNVDTLSKDGFSKTILNKKDEKEEELDEDEFFRRQRDFQKKYEKDLQHYGMLQKPGDSRKFLQNHPHLVCDKSANYLVIWCIDLEVEEKHSLMEIAAHQTIVLQFILQLSSTMKVDPRNCYNAFFDRMESMQADYIASFNDELESFKGRIKERAKIRVEEAVKRYEAEQEEQRQKELGPGGLHPADVMETLPEALRACFEKQDIPMLQKVVSEMDKDEAAYHIKRCVDSGLWLPNGGAKEEEGETSERKDEEEEYETINNDIIDDVD